MHQQRGASMLFVVLLVALAVGVLAWLGLPYFQQTRNEQIERDLNRGVAPSASVPPSTAAAQERARNLEFAEAHGGGLQDLVDTDHYRALSPHCRELIDAYVALVDQPAGTATDQPARRSSVAEIERRFGAECADGGAAAPAESPVQPNTSGTPAEK